MSIRIIDASCGSGKTEFIIRYLNENMDRPFLYISPLREMFDRIKGIGEYEGKGVNRPVLTPETSRYTPTLLQSIKEMIAAGVDIMSTHALFLRLDETAIKLLQERNYILVIDEALDAVSILPTKEKDSKAMEDFDFQELKESVSEDEIGWMQEKGFITIDKDNYNQIVWRDEAEIDHRYSDLRQIIKTGAMSYVNNTFLVWNFPVTALDAFEDVFVLTYRFRHSIFRCYLDFWEKSYEHLSIKNNGNSIELSDFSPEIEKCSQYVTAINICTSERLNAIGRKIGRSYPLSSSWYSTNASSKMMKVLKDNLTNYFRHYCRAERDSIMWTVYKKCVSKTQPKGYTKRSDGITPTLVSCNCKATEKYSDTYNLAYIIDKHLHPGVKAYFHQKGITLDNDEYALSELIQWLFRSRIRKYHKDETATVNLYIPSERMRNLLLGWMGCEIEPRKIRKIVAKTSD